MNDLYCAACLRDPSTSDAKSNQRAITITNGHALCERHFERLSDRQNEVHGTPSLIHLIQTMHAPADPPTRPWLIRQDEADR